MADSTYRVGVLLDLAAGRFRSGAKAAAKDTARLGGTLRKAGGDGSLMGRRVAEGARGARRELRQIDESTERLGRTFRRTSRDGGQSMDRLARRTKTLRTEMGLAAKTAGRLRGGLLWVAGIAGGGFAIASGLKRVISMEERMERLGIQSKSSTEEMARLRKEVYATANLPEIRLDPSQLLAAIEAVVEKTGDLGFARDNMLLIAQSIQGSGGTGDALGRLSAELRKLDIADPAGVATALNLITAQGKSGAFTLGNMAAQGERLFSAFARFNYQGEGAIRQLGAISQMARQSTGSSEQAATAVEALLRSLSDAKKVDDIWHNLGVNVRDATGAFRPLDRILKEIIDETGGDITRLSEIFDAEAIRAISGLATAQGRADYERFLTIEVPADMLGRDAARIAETTGAQLQETKTDVEDWMQDKLTGPLGEVVTALTSFKDELLVGVGLLAGSWYAFKGLRAAGRLLWRLAGGSGRGPGSRPRLGGGRTEAGGTGPGTRTGPRGGGLRGTGPGSRPRVGDGRLSGRGPGTRAGPRGGGLRGAGPGSRPRVGDGRLSGTGPGTRAGPRGGGLRGTGPGSRPRVGDGRLSGTGPGTRAGPRGGGLRGTGPGSRPRVGDGRLSGTGPGTRAGPRGGGLRGTGPGSRPRVGDGRLSGRGPGTRAGPRGGGLRDTGPGSRPRTGSRPPVAWAGGLWRTLARGLGPASAGAVMGLSAHDIATGVIPDDQVAPEVGGLMGGLGGSSAAGRAASTLLRSLPGPIRFGGTLLAGLGGWMGGESAGRAATDALLKPSWTAPESESAAQWILDLIPRHDPNAPPEIGNWRGVGLMQAPRRHPRDVLGRRRDRDPLRVERRAIEEWVPPALPEPEPTAARRQSRGRLDIGRNQVTVNVGPITVESTSADPREVAEEVADEIERRARDRGLGLRDLLLDDPTPEAVY